MKRKILYTSLSFLLPLSILLVVFKINGLFDDKTIISGDMFDQYYPLFNYLKDILDGKSSIFYSFNKGLGGTMFGTFFYYLSSPLNLLLIFINKTNIPEFMTYLTILKLSICGLTMYVYLSQKFKKSDVMVLAFSLCYALMGYNLNYFINIMWLDVVFLTPLVLLGIDRIIDNKSSYLYIITLFLSILSNYYISFMLCIFCIIYFIYEISLKKKPRKEKLTISKKFIVLSVLTGLMCSFFLIPCILEMTTYGRNIKLDEILTFDYNYFDILDKLYIGTSSINNILNTTTMNLYCSTIILGLVYLYLINKDIEKKERKHTLIIIILMILPCFIVPLNYMWHLFTLPTFYNYRYSYLLCLFMIIIAYKSITNLKISRIKIINYIIIVLINSFLFIIITKFSSYYPNLNCYLILLTLLFIILYNILLLKLKNKTIIVIVMIIEIIINTNLTFKNTEFDKIEVINNYQTFQNQLKNYNSDNRIDIIIKPKKDGFKTHSINNSIFLNYRTTSTFLSTNNINSYKVLINIGLNEDYNKHNYFENRYNSKIYNALFGNKYIISEQKDYDYELIDEINSKETYYVYKNPDYLSIGYIIKDKCNDIEFSFPYDEKILNCLVKSNNKYYIENKPIKQENNILEYDINNKGYYIIYKNKINKYIKEKDILTPIDIVYRNADYILLQNNKKNNKLKINSNISSEDIKVYNVDYKSIKKDIDELKLEQLNYKIEGNKLIGTIDTNGGILLLTLPYEKGYIIRVNGTPNHYEEVLSSFLGIKLDKGINEIVVEYKQPYLKQGIIMTLIAILITILYLNKLKKNN